MGHLADEGESDELLVLAGGTAAPSAPGAAGRSPPRRPGATLETSRREILAREADALTALAGQLERDGDAAGAKAVRARLPLPVLPNGASRFVPLPDVVASRAAVPPDGPEGRADAIRARTASGLFELAERAAGATPPRYALAGQCLRGAVERQPDHAETRRLLGYTAYKGGWARPFAVQQFEKGFIDHPVFGWVKADWQPHLERGELPSPPHARQGPVAADR